MRLVRSDVVGRMLRDRDGHVVGTLTDFYDYPSQWSSYWGAAEVVAGRFRKTRYLVDLTNAWIDRDELFAAHTVGRIRCMPRTSVRGALTPEQADAVLAHYWPSSPT